MSFILSKLANGTCACVIVIVSSALHIDVTTDSVIGKRGCGARVAKVGSGIIAIPVFSKIRRKAKAR